jgi:hypothetical protein
MSGDARGAGCVASRLRGAKRRGRRDCRLTVHVRALAAAQGVAPDRMGSWRGARAQVLAQVLVLVLVA